MTTRAAVERKIGAAVKAFRIELDARFAGGWALWAELVCGGEIWMPAGELAAA